ncbi:acetyl-CoA carboxylase biotin carboxylase subunit [Lactobacillus sp. CC-MHH1034]|uniref:acetyl-CoA carboxylase biotin carboxylase subunit n=1 Tax=Agrilactobacillus fermenti TaxID=2586909 RepID=UPI001E30B424|nr:acetyl-CoA carboxylase biotin carboxylase subunit [Agrilactobacillus fermenti]MCD2255920.1 acetyl-CoA carboxylase biotin carboxylase subunit [Agrilactobacillus fermenti]
MKKVLIANRGEIAVRIIRACHELGLKTVAVYATADAQALHVQLADEAVCIGPADPQKSYLNQPNILAAAANTQADAIHPGYGFLSENADFAATCNDSGFTFIGPTSQVMQQMGEKSRARATMQAAGVPITPGSDHEFTTQTEGLAAAKKIGYPVMLKASAGGGGKGMRVIQSEAEFKAQFDLAQSEAINAFGDREMYLEKYLAQPRHIEVQIAADQFGQVAILGERDCTIQQHHQKVIEEAPAAKLDAATRKMMYTVSANAVKDIGYVGVGTLEFLYNGPKQFYFMEMNTRIQVEHPITELTTTTDLVQLQLQIAAGRPLPFQTTFIQPQRYAIECRVNALSAGQVTALHLPAGNGVRVETALYQGYRVPPYYDAMIAKIIVLADTRQQALAKMRVALDETVIAGIHTNLDFLMQLIQEPAYIANQTNINWLDQLTQPAIQQTVFTEV